MTTPLLTADGAGEGDNEISIDYVALLSRELKTKKLLYIANIIWEIAECKLESLMNWTRDDLRELINDINESEDNKYKVKVLDKNKFADLVINVAKKKKEAEEAKKSHKISLPKLKVIFLDEDEENAMKLIKDGQQFMDNELDQMKQQLFQDLTKNKKNVEQSIETIYNELRQRFNVKHKQMNNLIDGIYQYYVYKVNSIDEEYSKSAKLVENIYNDYQEWLVDENLSVSDLQNKLFEARNTVENETNKIKKYQDMGFCLDIVLNEVATNEFFHHGLNLDKLAVEVKVINNLQIIENELKWNLSDEFSNLFASKYDDDNKEDNKIPIEYKIMYRLKSKADNNNEEEEEKKEDVNDQNGDSDEKEENKDDINDWK
eukprot:64171_1